MASPNGTLNSTLTQSVWEGFYNELPSSAGSSRLAPLPFKVKGLKRLKEEYRQECTNRLFYGDTVKRKERQKLRDTISSAPLTATASSGPRPMPLERLSELSSPKHPPRARPVPVDRNQIFASSLHDPHLRTFWLRKGILVDRTPRSQPHDM